jgi:hypothetical protein
MACLGVVIDTADANGEANTITLEAGTRSLTAVNNDTDGPNGRRDPRGDPEPGSFNDTQVAPTSLRFGPVGPQ